MNSTTKELITRQIDLCKRDGFDTVARNLSLALNRLDELEQQNRELVARLSAIETYWCREIGNSDWIECDRERYEHCQKSPEHDTKITYEKLLTEQERAKIKYDTILWCADWISSAQSFDYDIGLPTQLRKAAQQYVKGGE